MLIKHHYKDNNGAFVVDIDGNILAEMIYHKPSENRIIIEHTEVSEKLKLTTSRGLPVILFNTPGKLQAGFQGCAEEPGIIHFLQNPTLQHSLGCRQIITERISSYSHAHSLGKGLENGFDFMMLIVPMTFNIEVAFGRIAE